MAHFYGFATKYFYTEARSRFPNKISAANINHLKCPAMMCKFNTLPTVAAPQVPPVDPPGLGPGLNLGDCFGRVVEESCKLSCIPGYDPNTSLNAGDDTLTCQADLSFTSVGSTFSCTPQTCTSNFPITTVQASCGSRLAPGQPCDCTRLGGTVPGCLGVIPTPCDGKKVGETCIPKCKTGSKVVSGAGDKGGRSGRRVV